MVMPYVEPAKNTKGREYINRVVLPRFAERFKDQDLVINVGKHRMWDYSPFFNRPDKFVDYKNLDIKEAEGPDIIDNILASKLPDNHCEGMIYVGMDWDIDNNEQALKEIHRILKPGGLVAISLAAPGDTREGHTWTFHEALDMVKTEFLIDEIYIGYGPIQPGAPLYDEGDPIGWFFIARKRAT
jgi:SAM-dependent methyltransferase